MDIDRIARNIKAMETGGASVADIESYIAMEQARPSGSQGAASKPLGYARSLTEGATLGWGDEAGLGVAAGAAKLFADTDDTYGEIYDSMRETYDREQGQFRKENPYGSLGAEFAGGLATGGTALKYAPKLFAPVQSTAGRAAQLAGIGAGSGATAGAGFAKEGEKLKGAAFGGTIGGVLAPAVPLIGSAARKGSQLVQEAFPKLGGRNTVQRQVSKDLVDAGYANANEVKSGLTRLGPQATIADLSENTLGRAEAIANMPGAGRQAAQDYVARNAGAGRRIGDDINALFNGRANLGDFVEDIVKRSEREAGPKYQRAMQQQIEITPELNRILKLSDTQKAWKQAQRFAKHEGIDLPEIMKVAPDGKLIIESVPDMRSWDYIKKGLDAVIDRSGTTAMGKMDATGRSLSRLKSRMVSEIDKQNPDYAAARRVYGGLAETRKAAEEGLKFWNKTDHQIGRMLKDMSQSEKDAFRLGAMQKIYDEAKKTTFGGSVEKRLFNSADKVDKIKAMLQDDDAYRALEGSLRRESAFNRTYQATTQGSQTARRLAGAGESGIDPSLGVAALGGPKALMASLLGRAKHLGEPKAAQRQELAGLLMQPGQQAANAADTVFQSTQANQRLQELANFLAVTQGRTAGLLSN